jgi:hypothetical protein
MIHLTLIKLSLEYNVISLYKYMIIFYNIMSNLLINSIVRNTFDVLASPAAKFKHHMLIIHRKYYNTIEKFRYAFLLSSLLLILVYLINITHITYNSTIMLSIDITNINISDDKIHVTYEDGYKLSYNFTSYYRIVSHDNTYLFCNGDMCEMYNLSKVIKKSLLVNETQYIMYRIMILSHIFILLVFEFLYRKIVKKYMIEYKKIIFALQ